MTRGFSKLWVASRALNFVAAVAVLVCVVLTAPRWAAGLWDDEGQLGFLNLGAGGLVDTRDREWTKAGAPPDILRAEIAERNATIEISKKDRDQIEERIRTLKLQNGKLLAKQSSGGGDAAGGEGTATAASVAAPPQRLAMEWELAESRAELEHWLQTAATIEEVSMFRFLRGRVTSVSGSQVRGAHLEDWYGCALQSEFCDCTTGHVRFGHPSHGWSIAKERGGRECTPGKFTNPPSNSKSALQFCQCSILAPVDPNVCNGCGASKKLAPRSGVRADRPRSELCKGADAHVEMLWSCDQNLARKPRDPWEHVDAEEVLLKGTAEMCKGNNKDQLEVYLDCDFVEPYLRWTSDGSEWIEEAYMSYIGGPPGNKYEWSMLNLIRSVQMFSTRPIILVIFGSQYVPPLSWLEFPNLIVYRMKKLVDGLGFNFNKDRAMIGARVISGIELDSDQIITHPSFDDFFAATRKEVTKEYPFLISPVHWMSREPGTHPYPFSGFAGKRSMRWVHAHPTWTYWSIPFIHDMLIIRIGSQTGRQVSVWKFFQDPGWWAKSNTDMLQLLQQGEAGRVQKKYGREQWMVSDEPVLNAAYWLVGATKTWCKMDLEPDLWPKQTSLKPNMMADPKWFKDGVPLMFYSAHNTKGFSKTDLLLTLLGQCIKDDFYKKAKCTSKRMAECDLGGGAEEKLRLADPEKYQNIMCCCVDPRLSKPIFWKGQWYATAADVPGGNARGCIAV